jgi:hypothetical protein
VVVVWLVLVFLTPRSVERKKITLVGDSNNNRHKTNILVVCVFGNQGRHTTAMDGIPTPSQASSPPSKSHHHPLLPPPHVRLFLWDVSSRTRPLFLTSPHLPPSFSSTPPSLLPNPIQERKGTPTLLTGLGSTQAQAAEIISGASHAPLYRAGLPTSTARSLGGRQETHRAIGNCEYPP